MPTLDEVITWYATYRLIVVPVLLVLGFYLYCLYKPTSTQKIADSLDDFDQQNSICHRSSIERINSPSKPLKLGQPGLIDAADPIEEFTNSADNRSRDRIQEVLELERIRLHKQYKAGWLYFRCMENNLLAELAQLRADGRLQHELPKSKSSAENQPDASKPKLTIEMVPKTAWFSNLRSVLKDAQWEAIKRGVYAKANNFCEVCLGRGTRWPVEAHEIWHYDDNTNIQKLMGITALCPRCHAVKHFGLTSQKGRGPRALAHLKKINQWDEATALAYLDTQMLTWLERSKRSWSADLSALSNYGFSSEEISALEQRAKEERKGQVIRQRDFAEAIEDS